DPGRTLAGCPPTRHGEEDGGAGPGLRHLPAGGCHTSVPCPVSRGEPEPLDPQESVMEPRVDFFGNPLAGKVLRHINSATKVASESGVPTATQELVKIRASQINGCGFCTDMHTKDAAAAGESRQRLNLVAAWREATVFTEAERAALELSEQGTRIADAAGGVTDEAWRAAAKHYDDDQLIALLSLIALINAYNRINVINRQPAGSYRPGQFG